MRLGLISPPVPGHLHPFGALGRELIARGHHVTLFHMSDLEEKARSEGLNFVAIGSSDHPAGSLRESLAQLGKLKGLGALRFTIEAVRKTTEMICRDAPAAIQANGIEALVVDQTEPAGATVADHLRLPYATVAMALLLNREASVPPPFTGWAYREAGWARWRNRLGYAVSDRLLAPVTRTVARYRSQWKLPPYRTAEDSFSPRLQMSQQPHLFDYPRRRLPSYFHYLGPLRSPGLRETAFPWDRLDGRRLVYASLGTLQNGKDRVFRIFAEACAGLKVQLVIAHGGGLDEKTAGSFPGDPLVVSWAPQQQVLEKASLTLTHAGLNTVLDSLAAGVPIVAVPITYEQPAIAGRVDWSGSGVSIPLGRLTVSRLREAMREVLEKEKYSQAARGIEEAIRASGGAKKAASLIETLAAQNKSRP